jgi:3-hydroxybutyryl-CoA dehydratase
MVIPAKLLKKMKKNSKDLNNFTIGQKYENDKFISEDVVKKFAELSGDKNPIHINEIYAKKSRYRRKITHGGLIIAYFSEIYGMHLPGNGCVIAAQKIFFKKPLPINSTIKLIVEIIDINYLKRYLEFKNLCIYKKKIVIDGFTTVYIP